MDDGLATTYATILHKGGIERHYDPITPVAVVKNESGWDASVIGGLNGACYGLGQTCGHIFKVCRENGYKSAQCVAKMTPYLDGPYALRALSRSITRWRSTCRSITGKPALFHRWLHGYQGFGKRNRKTKRWIRICGMRPTKRGWVDVKRPRLVTKVMRSRLEIIKQTERKLRRQRRKK